MRSTNLCLAGGAAPACSSQRIVSCGGCRWSPSYKVGSIKEISVAYFGIVYLLTFLFMLFSFKQVKTAFLNASSALDVNVHMQMKDQKWDYLTSIWNWFDVINLSLFIASFYQSLVFMVRHVVACTACQVLLLQGRYSDITGNNSDNIDATTMYSLWMLSKAQSSIMFL